MSILAAARRYLNDKLTIEENIITKSEQCFHQEKNFYYLFFALIQEQSQRFDCSKHLAIESKVIIFILGDIVITNSK